MTNLTTLARDEVLDEICVPVEHAPRGLQTKSQAAPNNKAHLGAPSERQAVAAIGREVLRQGEVIERAMAEVKARGLPRPGALRAYHEGKMSRYSDPASPTRLAAKQAALDARMSALETKRNRPPWLASRWPGAYGQIGVRGPSIKSYYRQCVLNYMRSGQEVFQGAHLKDLARKAMYTELNPDGGYTLVSERDANVLASFLEEVSPMRQVCTVRSISAGTFEQVTRDDVADAGWVAERAERPETAAPKLGINRATPQELYAEPAATQTLLDDAMIDLESWLATEVRDRFAKIEGIGFLLGAGPIQPEGLLTRPLVTPATWVKGSYRYVPTGVAGDFPAAPNQLDPLVQAVSTLKGIYRPGASWMMNSNTEGFISLMKDTTGQLLWQPKVIEGRPRQLLGFPVTINEDMPDIAVDSVPILFGDFRRTYTILDRLGIRVLRDALTQKPFILFYTTKRVGGLVQMTDAMVAIRASNS